MSVGSLFDYEINEELKQKISDFLKTSLSPQDYARFVADLPEYNTALEIFQKFGDYVFFQYVLYCAVNDWELTNIHYEGFKGADALWHSVKDALLELKTFDVNELTKVVAEHKLNLPKINRNRYVLFSRCAEIVEKPEVRDLISKWTSEKVVDEASLGSVLDKIYSDHLDQAFRELYGKYARVKIPVSKVVNLVLRISYYILKDRGYNIKANKQQIMYDVHVAKVTLRLGLIRVVSKSSGNYFGVGFPVFGNKKLRARIVKAWEIISNKSSVSLWDIDALLWHVGRRWCIFDDQVVSPETRVCKVSCPYKARGREPDCPLKEVCLSYKQDLGIRVLSKRQTGSVELVILVNKLV